MTLFSSPSPQWSDLRLAAAFALRLGPVLDASGFWVLPEGTTPTGAYKADPGGSGFGIIDTTTIAGLNPTLLPSGFVITY